MPRLYLLDHSLDVPGGHHFDFALNLGTSAEKAGWEVVIGANCRYAKTRGLPRNWLHLAAFRYSGYTRFSMFVGGHRHPVNPHRPEARVDTRSTGGRRPGLYGALAGQLRLWRDLRSQHRRIAALSKGCEKVFTAIPPRPGDHVLLPTCTEFDLIGLTRFLARFEASQIPDWHLLFHYGFLAGRPPEYASQGDAWQAMHAHLDGLLSQLQNHHLHFHAVTQPLADQFTSLGLTTFHVLPHVVSPEVLVRSGERHEGPLRVLCAGDTRAEKGLSSLNSVVADLACDPFARGRVQILFQTRDPEVVARLAEYAPVPFVPGRQDLPLDAPLLHVPHPLTTDQYRRLLQLGDVGLFLYDGRRYAARCSAVMLELLSAGVPVIVPAGSWLADQISEPVAAYLDRLPAVATTLPVTDGRPMLPACLSIGETGDPVRQLLAVPPGAADLWLRFAWPDHASPGHYVQVACRQFRVDGQSVKHSVAICSQRLGGSPTPALFHLGPDTTAVELAWSNAYEPSPLALRQVECRFFGAASRISANRPLGQVGLIAADVEQVPDLVRDIADHYDHYLRTARDHAVSFRRRHHPDHLLSCLRQAAAGETGLNTRRRRA